ncbi:MAG: aldehyde dehydrogenase family protein, partial [Bdellovibrionales bacterium]|nr:aldehyde dehydrogenase family protein [Bdellovibrionales bacterium]
MNIEDKTDQNLPAIFLGLQQHAKKLRELSLSASLRWRESSLLRLKKSIEIREEKVLAALQSDLGKPQFEAFANEYGFILTELNHTLKEFRGWAQDERCETPVALWPASSKIIHEPKGAVLILAPWNYPFQLSLGPLIAAISAGNVALLKPSEFSPATSHLVQEIIREVWPDGEVIA